MMASSTASRGAIIAVASAKGGVGCTTIAALLARTLAARERRVLLVDMDPSGDLTAAVAEPEVPPTDRFGILLPTRRASAYALGSGSIAPIPLVLGNGVTLLGIWSRHPGERPVIDAARWRAALADMACGFDHVVIDCASGLGEIPSAAVSGADHVLVPTTLSRFPIEGAARQIDATLRIAETAAPGPAVLGVVVNEARQDDTKRGRAMKSMLGKIIDFSLVLTSRITRTDDELAFAYDDPDGVTASEFAVLVDELLARIRSRATNDDAPGAGT